MAEIEAKKTASADTPWFYALLPLVPLVLLFVFNKMVYKTIVLDVGTAMFIGWVFAILVDLATRRDLAKVFADGHAMFKGMGSMLTNVVGLIFVAALFADGLKNTGLVALLIEGAKSLGLGMAGTGLVVSAVIALVTLLTGSGVASFTGLVPIAPSVAAGLGSGRPRHDDAARKRNDASRVACSGHRDHHGGFCQDKSSGDCSPYLDSLHGRLDRLPCCNDFDDVRSL